MSVYRNLGSFRGDAKFSTWLFQIAAFRCTDYFRKRRQFAETDTEELEDHNELTMPEVNLSNARENQSIARLLQALSPDQRQVVELKFFQHFTFEEIGGQLGISPNTAKTRLYTALQKMRQASPVSLAASVN